MSLSFDNRSVRGARLFFATALALLALAAPAHAAFPGANGKINFARNPGGAYFMNPDKTIYGRFGSRSNHDQAEKDISIEGFRKAMLAALALFLARADGRRVLELASIRKLPWETLLLLGGSFSMAAAVQESGLAGFGAQALSELRTLPLLQQTLVAGFASVFISAFASNTATIGVLLPILWSAVPRENAATVLFAATIGCSCDFMLPAGTPPNAIVFGSGYLTIPRMAKTGIVLDLIAAVLAAAWCALVVSRVIGGVG